MRKFHTKHDTCEISGFLNPKGLREGFWQFKFSKTIIEGTFMANYNTGKWKIIDFENKSEYEGEIICKYMDGKVVPLENMFVKHGLGKYHTEQEEYIGYFENNKYNGFGVLEKRKTEIIFSNFKDGSAEGYSFISNLKNNSVIVGTLQKNRLKGTGKMFFPPNTVVSGTVDYVSIKDGKVQIVSEMDIQELLCTKWSIFFAIKKLDSYQYMHSVKERIISTFESAEMKEFFKFVVFTFEILFLKNQEADEVKMQQFIREIVLAIVKVIDIEMITEADNTLFLDRICKYFFKQILQVVQTKYILEAKKLQSKIFQFQLQQELKNNISGIAPLDQNSPKFQHCVTLLEKLESVVFVSDIFKNMFEIKKTLCQIAIETLQKKDMGSDDFTPFFVQFFLQTNHPLILYHLKIMQFFNNLELFNRKQQKILFYTDELMASTFLQSVVDLLQQDPSLDLDVAYNFDNEVRDLISSLKKQNLLFPFTELEKLFLYIFINACHRKEKMPLPLEHIDMKVLTNHTVKDYLQKIGAKLNTEEIEIELKPNIDPHFWRVQAERILIDTLK